jgi:hypothetical protein
LRFTAAVDQRFFQQHVELQQLLVAQLLAAAQLKVLLQQLPALICIPLQRLQQLSALAAKA